MQHGFGITKRNAHAVLTNIAYSTTIEEEMAKLEEHHPEEANWLKSRTEGNYNTHSIKHRCFPPMPNECIVCGRTGDDLYLNPCVGYEDHSN
jgi:hypothetical protein